MLRDEMPARSLRPVLTALAAGLALLSACGGGGGGGISSPSSKPAVSAISPDTGWRDDSTTIEMTGIDTAWSSAWPPTVTCDAAIPIGAVTVVSPTLLRVAVHVEDDASVGPHPMFVIEPQGYLTTPYFFVKAPIEAIWVTQPFAQASVLVGVLQANRPGDVIDALLGAEASNGSPIPLYIDDPHGFVVVLPESTPLGVFDLVVKRTGTDGTTTLRVPAGPVLARTQILTAFPAQVTLPTVDGTALHRYTAVSNGLVEMPMTSQDPSTPLNFLYPHESPWAPPVVGLAPTSYGTSGNGPRAIALSGETFDVVVFPGHGTYGMSVSESPAPLVAEHEGNDFPAAAQALPLPALVFPATIDAGGNDDWYAVDVSAADVGKSLRVVGSPGASLLVSVLRADAGTLLGGASAIGPGAAVEIKTGPLPAAERVYVVVQKGSPSTPDPTTAYRLFLRLEAP